MYYQNVSGMRTKSLLFNAFSSQFNYDVIVITETWLNSDFYSEEFFNPSLYIVYRKDRDSVKTGLNKGGGVLIAVKTSYLSANLIIQFRFTFRSIVCFNKSSLL